MMRGLNAYLFGLVIAMSGCAGIQTPDASEIVPLSVILVAPQNFDGTEIKVCGWLQVDMELCALSYSNHAPKASDVWILPASDICLPLNAFETPGKGWAIISGVFRTGGGFGLFGEYNHLLEASHITLVKKPCSEP